MQPFQPNKRGFVIGQSFPDKVFMIKKEKEKPYKKLDFKFTQLYNKAFKEYKTSRRNMIKNFKKTTKLVL